MAPGRSRHSREGREGPDCPVPHPSPQHTAPRRVGASGRPLLLRVQPPKLQEKPAPGFVYFWSFHWLGEEVSLVRGDLTVGHREFEGLRKKERKGFPLHPPRSRGPLLTKTGPLSRDLNASPAGGSLLMGKSLSHLWEPRGLS